MSESFFTCPTKCVEKNHPGREHEEWVAENFSLPLRDRLVLWVNQNLRRCPECGQIGRRVWAPRHDEDRVARMLNIPVAGRCGDCGKAVTA